MKLKYNIYSTLNTINKIQIEKISNFLVLHLEEYGDKKEDILKAINYSLSAPKTPGGFIITVTDDTEKLIGATVVNKTGMDGYIPPNILVYIAVHNAARGHGVGLQMMKMTIDAADGDIALHVEPNNPAKRLYEKLGFTQKYVEMRYLRPS